MPVDFLILAVLAAPTHEAMADAYMNASSACKLADRMAALLDANDQAAQRLGTSPALQGPAEPLSFGIDYLGLFAKKH